ncbi:MAG: transcriptional regulator, AraC family [Anaerocolumna sp.]|nr:transcriptional regulator, AraC family [Anaerocolumna sp.]
MSSSLKYPSAWEGLAVKNNFEIRERGIYKDIIFPSVWENGWICEVMPVPGLYASSAWFTAEETIEYTIKAEESSLLLICLDCGDITFTQRGRQALKLSPFTQIITITDKPVKLSIQGKKHACFTSVQIYEACIESFLEANGSNYPVRIHDAREWKVSDIDRPNVMMAMEQIRWGVRCDQLPLLSYLCKAMDILCLIAHNTGKKAYTTSRRQHVTWNDEMKLWRVGQRIAEDPLNPPAISEMCKLAEMCESKLRVEFKSIYGMTIYNYIREAVMKRAMQMLADDGLSIKSISVLCGYENHAKFTAVFKKIHGITPSDFRKTFEL